MNRILLLTFTFVLYGCNSISNNKPPIFISDGTILLEKTIARNSKESGEINPKNCLESIIDFFYLSKTQKEVITTENPIALYVLYATDFWKESNIKTFEITFVHQTVGRKDKNLYEYRITLIYDFENFKGIKEFSSSYEKSENINIFIKIVTESVGYKKALLNSPKRIEVIKEEI